MHSAHIGHSIFKVMPILSWGRTVHNMYMYMP